MPGSPGRLRFAHALIRDTLYDELTAGAPAAAAPQAGEALEAVYAADAEPHLAELAHHFAAAAPAGAGEKAVDYARRAGDRAASQLAYEEAVRLYEMALALRDRRGRPAASCCSRSATPRRGRATRRRSKGAFREAAELAERLGARPSSSPARRSATAAGSSGRSRATTPHSCRCSSARSRRSATTTARLRVRLLARLAGGPLREAGSPRADASR